MLFSDVILFDPRMSDSQMSASISRNEEKENSLVLFFSRKLTCERRSLFQDMT